MITTTSSKQKIKLNLENIIKSSKPIKKFGLDFLLYYIIDYIYELEYNILEIIGEKIDDIEDKILQDPERKDLNYIYKIKKDLIYIRKSLWPAQNVIRNIIVSGNISHKIEFYFQDLQSRTVQSIDIIETYHEICSSMLDTYLSSIGNKTNEIMRVLTVFSTIFIPLTFIAGVYGMNFRYFPELNFKYSYPLFWIISVIITIGMIFYFKRKDWL